MGREDFNLLSDADILNALDVATCKLHAKLWPKVLVEFPSADADVSEKLFELCKYALAEKHGITELLQKQEAR